MMVPTMMARLLALAAETLRKYDTSSLRWVMSGAAPLPTERRARVEDAFGPILCNFYGATETGLVTLAGPGEHTARPGTIGRARRGNEIRLLDDDGHEVPDGPGRRALRAQLDADLRLPRQRRGDRRRRSATASSPSATSPARRRRLLLPGRRKTTW